MTNLEQKTLAGSALVGLFVYTGCSHQPTMDDWFTEEASKRGIEYVHESGFTDRPYLPEIVGGGVALIDVENDGDLDIYFIQSGFHLASESDSFKGDELYLNDGNARFEKSQPRKDKEKRLYGMGATVGDYDSDGDPDIYVTNYGKNELLQNDGQGRFIDVAEQAGVSDSGWSTAAAFSDFDNDGDLDLFVTNYLTWSVRSELDCYSRGNLTYCLPTNYQKPARDTIYRNNGDGSFTNVTIEARIHTAFGNGLGAVPADFNGDDLIDVFVANDTMVNQLWLNQGGWRFENAAVRWGCAVDNHGIAKAGMGVDAADVDNDADQDVLVVNLEGQSDSLFVNQSTYFRDQTSRSGLGTGSRRFTRFGIALADFDNDGVLDLIEANGKVDGDPTNPDDEFAEPNMLFKGSHTEDGIWFEPISAIEEITTDRVHTSRALAVGDLDNDGDLDTVIINRDEKPYLLLNQVGQDEGWIRFRVLNHAGTDALGATVSLTSGDERQTRYVKVSGSYLASHDPRVHFGIGDAREVENVIVRWPTGEVREFGRQASQRLVTVELPK